MIDLQYVSPPIPNLFFANPCSTRLALSCLGDEYFLFKLEFGMDLLMFLVEYDDVSTIGSLLFHYVGLKNCFVDVYTEVFSHTR